MFEAFGSGVNVGYRSIRENEQNSVRLLTIPLGLFLRANSMCGSCLHDFGEHCRSRHYQTRSKYAAICLDDVIHTIHLRGRSSLEAMTNNTSIFGSKSKHRKLLVVIIFCQYAPNGLNGLLVIVQRSIGVDVVKSAGLTGVAITSRKVDRYAQIQFTAPANIINKRWSTSCCTGRSSRNVSRCRYRNVRTRGSSCWNLHRDRYRHRKGRR
mmetsp:Transcript_4869/g.11604  ORF Transcript_4869/g.11604 Transcript_4869/m.11604 type:complete len:210 (+) Transcript_4869:1877-2506(+)